MLKDCFGLALSQGTLVNFAKKADTQVKPSNEAIKQDILDGLVANFDETSIYQSGKTQWLHSASNEHSTLYFPHQKRGTVAMDAMGILPQFMTVGLPIIYIQSQNMAPVISIILVN